VTTKHLSISDYYTKMCTYAEELATSGTLLHHNDLVIELATSGTPLHHNELVTYLLAGLDEDYNTVFTVVVARSDLISSSELCVQLMSLEHHTSLQATHTPGGSAMAASCGSGYSSRRGSAGSDRGHGRSHSSRDG
jgi:hypothetical protein